LLALAPVLAKRAGAIYVPVYLGDAMQLSISEMIGGRELTIRVPPPAAGEGQGGAAGGNGKDQLEFPDTFCRDPGLFDKAIERMRSGSEQGMSREQIEKALYRITEQHYRADVTREQQLAIQDLGKTYVTFDKLRREGRDSVWAYVARNLSRPLAFSAGGGWANVIVGNPPWVAFRHMSADLQKRFKELASGLGVYVGGKLATQNDLCALFTARSATLYLRGSGRIAFVLPLAALTRGQFERLRSGVYHTGSVQWDEAWTMDDSVQPLFPVPSCVAFGRRRATAKAMPETVRAYSGALPMRDAPEALVDRLIAEGRFSVAEGAPKPTESVFTGGSAYRAAFRQGATLVPRMLCLVERKAMGRVGVDTSAPPVVSRRNPQEKMPWKELSGIENRVEAEFLHPVMLGESILPFTVFRAVEGVVPVTETGETLDSKTALDRGFDHLSGWMRKAEATWNEHRVAALTLTEQFDYYGKLASQFPIAPLRVVYAASGTVPAACVLRGSKAVIEHKLYWTTATSAGEARYLAAILNSETARERTAKYQSRGQWGARDFDKVVFNLPIPRYDSKIKLHRDLAAAAERAEAIAAAVALPEGAKFQRARSLVRAALRQAGLADAIDALVAKLLDGA